MRITASLLAFTLLSVGSALPAAPPADAQGPRARIWVENDRDYFRRGDRLRVSFSTSANSYVAVVHVDPDGYLEFLYPTSPWDNEFVRGGRTYAVDRSGWSNGLMVRGSSGIGYLYVIASPEPLDYSRFSAGSGWDWSYAGRSVSGDPFWAMEQITRMLLPRWGNVPYTADYYTYHVGGIHRYPSYACSGRQASYGWGYYPGWDSYYGSCDRLDFFLRDNPYYFDSRRYRGNRNVYYDRYRDSRDWDPRHGYKADPVTTSRPTPRAQAPETGDRARVAAPQGGAAAPTSRPAQRVEPARPVTAQEPRSTARAEPAAAAPAARTRPTPTQEPRATPAPSREPAASAPARPRPAPSAPRPVERQPERAAPAREAPAPARPAREAPQRSSGATSRPAPSSRGSSGDDGGSSTSTPRSRRGDD